jgi:hypothetical protein
MRHAVTGLRREVLALSNAVFAMRQSRKTLDMRTFSGAFPKEKHRLPGSID